MGVDLSPVRVKRFMRLTGQPAILANGEKLVGVTDASVDLCISTMVMEHVPNDAADAEELARIVKPGGWLYLTTVLRKRGPILPQGAGWPPSAGPYTCARVHQRLSSA